MTSLCLSHTFGQGWYRVILDKICHQIKHTFIQWKAPLFSDTLSCVRGMYTVWEVAGPVEWRRRPWAPTLLSQGSFARSCWGIKVGRTRGNEDFPLHLHFLSLHPLDWSPDWSRYSSSIPKFWTVWLLSCWCPGAFQSPYACTWHTHSCQPSMVPP